MLKAFWLEMKAMTFTPSLGTRRKVWRTLYGGEPSPQLLDIWKKSFPLDYAECRELIRLGWDRYEIGDAFARLFEWQYAGRLDASLTEAALDVKETPNEVKLALDRRRE